MRTRLWAMAAAALIAVPSRADGQEAGDGGRRREVTISALPADPLQRPQSAAPATAPANHCAASDFLAAAEVLELIDRAARALASPTLTVAVSDRLGQPLAVYRRPGAPVAQDDEAIGLARTAAFFSNDQAPLSSRTVRVLSGIHFPPGIARTPNAALYGIENTNRGCDLEIAYRPGKEVPPARSIVQVAECSWRRVDGCGTGPVTGKLDPFDSDFRAVNPGGVPIFKVTPAGELRLVGGIGVAGVAGREAEFAAFSAAFPAGLPAILPPPQRVFIDGIRLPFVEQITRPAGSSPGAGVGPLDLALPASDGDCAPDGYLAGPHQGSRLNLGEVERIVQQAIDAAARTRAVIRLPLGSRARMVIAVADLDGDVLALFRMPDATVFSVDVAVSKARNVVYFSGNDPGVPNDLPGVPAGTAITNRTISFGAQPLYPPGIDGSGPGPFFDLYLRDLQRPCSQGSQAPRRFQSGVVFFPGSIPLYRGGELVGGLGISGDGVEQDDYVSFLGAAGFLPEESRWADRITLLGVRLPFLKFPRNPER